VKGRRVTRLGDLVEILSGFAFESEYFSDEGDIPIARIRDVVPGTSSTYFTGDFDPKYLVTDGDLLVGMDGEFNRATWRGGRALLNQRVCRIRAASGALRQDYLFYLLPLVLDSIEASTPFVTVKHLSVKALQEYPVALPSVDEQHRIAEILDQADALRAKRRAALAQVDGLTQAIFVEIFGDPVRNPLGWPDSKVEGALASLQYGPRFYDESYSERGVRIVRITDLAVSGELDFESMPRLAVSDLDRRKYELRGGDILFARTGATVGKTALIRGSDPSCIAGAYFITLRFENGVLPEYARQVLASASVQEIVVRRSRQAAQQNFSGPGLRELPMPVPPPTLQREFAHRAAAVDKLKATHRTSLAHLDALFASLQHRAFRGEL
jgi:type I restriction enzyme S subunit